MTAMEANFRETSTSVNQICFVQNFQFHPSFRGCCPILSCTSLISTVGKMNANKKIEPVQSPRLV